MINYTQGSTYRKGIIDVKTERIPQNPAFRSFMGEKHFFEEREGNVSYFQVTSAIESGRITELDKTIVCITATFGAACVTTKVLKEMLIMMGISFSDSSFDSSIKRLHRYQFINFSHFAAEGMEPSKMKIITLAKYGSELARSLGVVHRYKAIEIASSEAFTMKSRAQTAHLICNYLKNRLADSFAVRPLIIVDPANDAIVRPSASITARGEQIYFEIPRRHDTWKEDLVDKLKRYELVFAEGEKPTVVINGEDEDMNREIEALVRENGFTMEYLYTEDLLMFGERFRSSLYSFNPDGSIQCYEFMELEAA